MGAHAGRGKCLEEGSTVSEKYMCTIHTYEHLTCGNISNAFVYTCTYSTYEHYIQYVCTYVHLTCGNILVHLNTYMYTYVHI